MARRVAFLAPLLVFAACGGASDGEVAPPRNLVLVSIDTLRADRLGAYGYGRETSPALDALAERGARFETVIAESSWTLPSHVTLFSGLPPTAHGVVTPLRRPSTELPLLTEVLYDAGFRTFGFTAGRFLDRRFGFDRGFQVFEDMELSFSKALDRANEIIDGIGADERFFVFVHTYDVHCPYDPPPDYAQRFRTRPSEDEIETAGRCGNPHFNSMGLTPGQVSFLSDRYDAGIRRADDLLAGFLTRLEASGRDADTLVAVVSDHGEEFLEHGQIGHRATLYIESLRVPWIVAGPGIAPGVVAEPAGLSDVMPTLLGLLGVEAPAMLGSSFAARLRDPAAAVEGRPVFSENNWGALIRSVVAGEHHLISRRDEDLEIYDWRRDPLERENLAGRDASRDRELWSTLNGRFNPLTLAGPRAAPEPVDAPSPSERDQLRALGYVD